MDLGVDLGVAKEVKEALLSGMEEEDGVGEEEIGEEEDGMQMDEKDEDGDNEVEGMQMDETDAVENFR